MKTSVCTFSDNIRIPGNISFTLHSALNETSPQFTLTCISTGGPATTVIWTRTTADFGVVTIQNVTLANNYTLPRYIHTLNVTGRLRGLYTCTVGNDETSDSAQHFIKGNRKYHLTMQMRCIFPTASYSCQPSHGFDCHY